MLFCIPLSASLRQRLSGIVSPLTNRRILNRFSKDIETIDNQTIHNLQYFLYCLFTSLSTLGFIGILTPSFLIAVPFISVIFAYYGQLYLNTSRELKRLESVSKSPIYSQFSETLAGVSSIRAYEASERFIKANEKRVDTNNKGFIYMWTCNRWLSLRTDLLSSLIVFFAGFAIILGGLEAGWAAMMINFSMELTWQVRFVIRMHGQLEMNMNSVERVGEFSEIDQEAPAVIEGHRPPTEWPQKGGIQIQDLSMRYAPELPDVLKNITFEVLPHEKVAVVGRTGAGKSTLSLAFFRIIPFSNGSITIDDINIADIGLHDLRR
jgi:ABC-type multidrug transport system fused ATPase/permease subunit